MTSFLLMVILNNPMLDAFKLCAHPGMCLTLAFHQARLVSHVLLVTFKRLQVNEDASSARFLMTILRHLTF